MKIEYYEVCGDFGIIYQKTIDTNDKNYISHDDNSVTFSEYDDVPYSDRDKVTRTRNFQVINEKRITAYKKAISDLQSELSIHERSSNYEQYSKLLYKKS